MATRRERRAKATKASDSDTFDPQEIPMIKPDFDAKPTGKTLYELVDERYAELHKNDYEYDSSPGDPLGPFANAFVYCISLSMVHITLDVIVLTQYQQDLVWNEILARIAKMTPGLFVVLYLFHTSTVKRWHQLRQVFFLGTSVAAGCYLIHAANRYGYYFVMKKAPPVGTLWVWSVVEMDLWYAVAHAITVLGFMKLGGYRAF